MLLWPLLRVRALWCLSQYGPNLRVLPCWWSRARRQPIVRLVRWQRGLEMMWCRAIPIDVIIRGQMPRLMMRVSVCAAMPLHALRRARSALWLQVRMHFCVVSRLLDRGILYQAPFLWGTRCYLKRCRRFLWVWDMSIPEKLMFPVRFTYTAIQLTCSRLNPPVRCALSFLAMRLIVSVAWLPQPARPSVSLSR